MRHIVTLADACSHIPRSFIHFRNEFPYITVYQLERADKHSQPAENNNIVFSAGTLFTTVCVEINKRISSFQLQTA